MGKIMDLESEKPGDMIQIGKFVPFEFRKIPDQPERIKREDLVYCVVCKTKSREPEIGAGHYCQKCKEYDYA